MEKFGNNFINTNGWLDMTLQPSIYSTTGLRVPIHDYKKGGKAIQLCLTMVDRKKILAHLYNEWECTKFWWHRIGFSQPMNLREILAPIDKSYANLRNLNWFVKVVRKAYSVRRRGAENSVLSSWIGFDSSAWKSNSFYAEDITIYYYRTMITVLGGGLQEGSLPLRDIVDVL
ncbi:hypothetical protein JCM33374_g2479 [Metschnikowia sp. JCM 33374]|nr:hypothetical protein JCM33374_g2479 [Metschnikowia sp. JCM 33374]